MVPRRGPVVRWPEGERLSWDPARYLKFGGLRLRPAMDLLARVSIDAPAVIVDLGCGTGMVTAVLRERWPDSRIVGVDASPEMLERARQQVAGVDWRQADVEWWSPDTPPDLIVSNAVLHWLDDHDRLFPRLVRFLAKGGTLAVQMPRNFSAPSHTCITQAVDAGPWRDRLLPLTRPNPVALPAHYYGLLKPYASTVEVWEIEYYQVLDGEAPVVEWTSGTILRPLLGALTEDERDGFLRHYERCVSDAYPPGPDGMTLFPFKRLFILACA